MIKLYQNSMWIFTPYVLLLMQIKILNLKACSCCALASKLELFVHPDNLNLPTSRLHTRYVQMAKMYFHFIAFSFWSIWQQNQFVFKLSWFLQYRIVSLFHYQTDLKKGLAGFEQSILTFFFICLFFTLKKI